MPLNHNTKSAKAKRQFQVSQIDYAPIAAPSLRSNKLFQQENLLLRNQILP